MKHVKTLGLLAVAAAALMAVAGTASATTLTSSEGSTPEIAAAAGATSFDGAFTTVTCQKSAFAGSTESHGSSATTTIRLFTLHFNECNFPVTVHASAGLLIHWGWPPKGTMEAGLRIIIHTSVGSCEFTSNNTELGALTGSSETGGNAVLDISGKLPRTGGNFLCGSSGTWTGSYTITQPSTLNVDS